MLQLAKLQIQHAQRVLELARSLRQHFDALTLLIVALLRGLWRHQRRLLLRLLERLHLHEVVGQGAQVLDLTGGQLAARKLVQQRLDWLLETGRRHC